MLKMIKYNNITEIDWISKKEVEEKKKTDLKNYEYLGIEEVINQLIQDYEWDYLGSEQTNIKDHNFFRNDNIKLEEAYQFDNKRLSKAFISDEMIIGEFECFKNNIEMVEPDKEGEWKYYRID